MFTLGPFYTNVQCLVYYCMYHYSSKGIHIHCLFFGTGYSALMIAAKVGDSAIVQILISASAILDFKEKKVQSVVFTRVYTVMFRKKYFTYSIPSIRMCTLNRMLLSIKGVITPMHYAVPPTTAVKVWSSGQGDFSSLVKASLKRSTFGQDK